MKHRTYCASLAFSPLAAKVFRSSRVVSVVLGSEPISLRLLLAFLACTKSQLEIHNKQADHETWAFDVLTRKVGTLACHHSMGLTVESDSLL